jgi:hypothetical protein
LGEAGCDVVELEETSIILEVFLIGGSDGEE